MSTCFNKRGQMENFLTLYSYQKQAIYDAQYMFPHKTKLVIEHSELRKFGLIHLV